jgi:iron complex transport system ATP-binding protein
LTGIMLDIDGISCSYGATPILQGVSFSIPRGGFTGIIGPNGSGKSTLLKCLSRVLPLERGQVLLDGKAILRYTQNEIARRMAVVAQEQRSDFSFTAREVVQLGRIPHLGRWERENVKDHVAVQRAMELTGVTHLASRPLAELSGGEKQRVFLAMALAQEPEVLLLDEPTSHLDINYQIELMDLIKNLNCGLGLTVVTVLHDLNLAAQYCQNLILLDTGRVAALGPPEQVITVANIRTVYHSEVIITTHPVHHCPAVVLTARQVNPLPRENLPVRRVHVICGGGTGAALLEALIAAGYAVSAGVLNSGDTDWQKARELGIPCVEAAPFSPVTEKQAAENLMQCRQAHLVVLTEFPLGPGNLANLQYLETVLADGIPAIMFNPGNFAARDYTGGKASLLFERLRKNPGLAVITQNSNLATVERFFEQEGG